MTEQPAARSAVSGVVVADNEKKLRQQIDQTRQELGDTVAQLVAKVDVKRQVQAKRADIRRQVQAKSADVKSQAQAKRAVLASRAKATANPEQMRRTAMKGANVALERRRALIAAGATAGAAGLGLLWWRKKRS